MSKTQKSLLFSSVFNFILGMTFWISGSWLVDQIIEIIGLIILWNGVVAIIKVPMYLVKKSDKPMIFKLLDALLTIGLGVLIMAKSLFPAFVLAGFIALYILLMGGLKLFNFILLKNDGVKGYWWVLFTGIGYLLVGWHIFNLKEGAQELFSWLGVYLIFNSLSLFKDFIDFNKVQRIGKRRRRVGAPIIFTALISHEHLNRINDFINKKHDKLRENDIANANDWLDLDDRVVTVPDLEVWVHTSSKKGFDAVGHVDISYNGVTYSYGNYDVDSHKLFGTLGDGILYQTATAHYEEWIHQIDSRAVFRYGLVLNAEQKLIIEQQIEQIKLLTHEYTLNSPTQVASYLGQLQNRYTDTKVFKFKRSKFKTYFVLTTNCVLLADHLIGNIGIDIINRSGLMTPGAYQQYLDSEYMKPNSFVVNRTLLYVK